MGTVFLHLLTGKPADSYVHLLTGGCFFLLSALYYARILDVDSQDLDHNGRFDRRWACGIIIIMVLAIALVWMLHG